MLIHRLLVLAGLSVLFAGCTTASLTGGQDIDRNLPSYASNASVKQGIHYLYGRGVEQSDSKAFYYFNKAAREGDRYAQNEVAFLYAAGKGTRQDYSKAFYWYHRAALSGVASAKYNLGLLYIRGLGIERNEQQGLGWIKQAANQHFEPANVYLVARKSHA